MPRVPRARTGLAATAALVMAMAAGGVSRAQTTPGDALLDRTLAVVGGRPILRSEVDLAERLGLLAASAVGPDERPLARLIERALMLTEVARFSPSEPNAAAVDRRLAAVRERAGAANALAAALARAGVSMAYVEAWIRDDLRIEAYLEQRFASAGALTDAEVDAYQSQRAEVFARAGVSPDDARRLAREQLVQERRRGLMADWLADVRRRTDVVEFTPEASGRSALGRAPVRIPRRGLRPNRLRPVPG